MMRDLASESQAIAIGAKVIVFRFGEHTAPFIEGIAVVQNLTTEKDCYEVQFVGENTIKRRVLCPEFQQNPNRTLAMLLNIWRAENFAAADTADFFPDDFPPKRG